MKKFIRRRLFLKDSMLAGVALSLPGILKSAPTGNASPFFKLNCNNQSPEFDFFSIDSLGKNNLDKNIILHEISDANHTYIFVDNKKGKATYHLSTQKQDEPPAWEVILKA